MQIISVTACENWFAINLDHNNKTEIRRIAAWGLTSDGVVHGLVAWRCLERNKRLPELSVPDIYENVRYAHLSDLTDEERKAANIK